MPALKITANRPADRPTDGDMTMGMLILSFPLSVAPLPSTHSNNANIMLIQQMLMKIEADRLGWQNLRMTIQIGTAAAAAAALERGTAQRWARATTLSSTF